MTFEQAHQRVEDELAKVNLVAKPELLYKPIAYTLSSGGKRIRPALCLMACEAFGSDLDNAVNPALALEIFHNFTLLHDDIMDNDEVRRNRLTVHKKWNQNVAILSGDAMQILAYQFLAKTPEACLKKVLDVFSDTALKVCQGQQYDMDFETQETVDVGAYLTMIEYKTAVLIEASLKIGALVGGATDEEVELFGQFGKNLGLAFQLRDDWLDSFGNLETFGKPIGSDIVNNKKTYLLMSALQMAEGKQKELLNSYMNDESIEKEEKIRGVKALFRELGIDELTQRQSERFYEASIHALEKLDISNKSAFLTLAERLLKRSN
jgi:geranylgeranyl diphosphate synthase type II